jgi:glutamyl-tRNA synthetase
MANEILSRSTPPRVRFAPSPTGFLHVGSARTFIFNWLYARHNGGTMVLRLDDTDVERNTDASVQSIFEGLRWLGLDWDEEYKQSERLALHRQQAEAIFAKGLAYRDFTPAHTADEPSSAQGAWLHNPGMRELSRAESDRRAAAGEPFALRYRVPRGVERMLHFVDSVYGAQSKLADEVEDFALLRSRGRTGLPLGLWDRHIIWPRASDDADLRISHIIRGQDHLTNTFKHLLIFEALGVDAPQFAHLPLLVAPDGAKLSKRKHGPVVSVTTYRDAGFLPGGFHQLSLPAGLVAEERSRISALDELTEAFTLEGVNRSNAVVNFTEERSVRSQGCVAERRAYSRTAGGGVEPRLKPFFAEAGLQASPEKAARRDAADSRAHQAAARGSAAADFFFLPELAPYDPAELIPQKGDAAMALRCFRRRRRFWRPRPSITIRWTRLRAAAASELGLKAGPMFQPIRVAVCGRKNAPPLFETMIVLGREVCLSAFAKAEVSLQSIG